jgi:hypothetical protein
MEAAPHFAVRVPHAANAPRSSAIGFRDHRRSNCCWIEFAISSIGSDPVTACCTPAMITDDADAKAGPNGGVVNVGTMFALKLL